MKAIRLLSFAVPTLVACIACTGASPRHTTPVPIARGAEVCKSNPAICEKRCANCKDPAACVENGGECAGGIHFNDLGDVGPDIWKAGCHYSYDDDACTPDGQYVDGDICGENPKELIEWTVSTCHPPTGDLATYDCDKECLNAGRGHGTCTPLPTECSGRRSAHCTCDRPAPPTPTPTP